MRCPWIEKVDVRHDYVFIEISVYQHAVIDVTHYPNLTVHCTIFVLTHTNIVRSTSQEEFTLFVTVRQKLDYKTR